MTQNFVLVACVSVASIATAQGQPPLPPEIEIVNAQRDAAVGVDADGVGSSNQANSMIAGPFVEIFSENATGPEGSNSIGSASQDSYISNFAIHGSGEVDVSANVTPTGLALSSGNSSISVGFMIPVDAPFSFKGTLDSSLQSLGLARAEVSLTGAELNGLPFFYQRWSQPGTGSEGEVIFDINADTVGQVEIKANTLVTLIVQAQATVGFGGIGDSQGVASFEVSFDLGDRDGDGLLNIWETDGIDFPGSGIEIDLPSMGANPDVKDIFVEVDVMSGVAFDQTAVDDVAYAFAQAPASMVDNYDGSAGIQLHVIVDGDRPPHQPFSWHLSPTPPSLPPEFYDVKDVYFGSQSDRNHPDRDAIRAARLRIFRYCLWADTLFDTDPSDSGHIIGAAEGVPSNDFILAAGRIRSKSQDNTSAKLSSFFMHEFGHTLGLQHGGFGAQNLENNKPNYLSVMNYAYSTPFTKTTAQGTNVADFWRLDYSRSTMIDLDETELFESHGLMGPAGRAVYFNSANESDPEPVKRGIWWAHLSGVNWNLNGGSPKVDPYELDITRNDSSVPVDYDSTLESYTDWDRLWYDLAGNDQFNDRQPLSFASPSAALREATILAFYDVEWVDLTALGDEVFSNGFELGSTTAWSDTSPR